MGRREAMWLVICVAVALIYGGTLDAPFVYDDKIEVIGNTTLRMAEDWQTIVGYNISRSLLMLSYAWNHRIFGLDPAGYHLTNIAIHLLGVGAALFMAEGLGRLGGHPRPLRVAGLAVGVWAVHPMCTEAVTYTTGRSESLCALFSFLALGAWARALQEGGCWRWRTLGVLAFLGALTTKEVGAVIPLAFLAMEWAMGRRLAWRWSLGMFGLLGLAAWARWQQLGTLLHAEVDRELGVQLVTMAEVWLRYIALWFAPVGQTLFHHQVDLDPQSLRGAVAIGGWLALVGGGVWLGRRRPLVGLALIFGALFLLPSSSIVSLKENLAEHRAHQLGLYLCLAVVWGVERWAPRWALGFAGLAMLAGMGATVERNEVWDSEVALWQEATQHRPDVADAWYGLGDAHRFVGEFPEASRAFERALDLDPDHLDAWNNLGISQAELGDADAATRSWKKALRVKPSYCKAHNNLGMLAFRRQRWDLAIQELRSTLSYCPEDPIAHYGLGNIHFGPRRDKRKAIAHYETLLDVAPTFSEIEQVKKRLFELTF
jgi:tetratricopeptide (TPR) repeat protein